MAATESSYCANAQLITSLVWCNSCRAERERPSRRTIRRVLLAVHLVVISTIDKLDPSLAAECSDVTTVTLLSLITPKQFYHFYTIAEHSRVSRSFDCLIESPPRSPPSCCTSLRLHADSPHSLEHARLYGDLWTVLVKAPTTSATAGTITFRSFFDACSSPLRQRVHLLSVSNRTQLAAATACSCHCEPPRQSQRMPSSLLGVEPESHVVQSHTFVCEAFSRLLQRESPEPSRPSSTPPRACHLSQTKEDRCRV